MPYTIKTLGEWQGTTFAGCISLEEINIPSGIAQLTTGIFRGCSKLKRIILPEGVTTIKSEAFADCISLEELILPESIKEIEYSAFAGCESLKELILPKSLAVVRDKAFKGCTKLSKLTILNDNVSLSLTSFAGCSSLKTIVKNKFNEEDLFTIFADSPIEKVQLISNNIETQKVYKEFESDLRMASMYYHSNDMNITKIHGYLDDEKSFKAPDRTWNHSLDEFYSTKQDSGIILRENWFRASGIGLVLGWNNYHAIDVDNINLAYGGYGWNREFIQSMINECLGLLGLPATYPWVVISGSGFGFHIIFKSENNVDDSIGSIAYTPNEKYIINRLCSDRVFERMELRWKDHLILPPSIHKSSHKYNFLQGDYPTSTPQIVSIGNIDKLITHYCGRITFNNYNYYDKPFQLVELDKCFAQYDSWSYNPAHVEDTIPWLEQSGTPEALNTLAIKYILGNGVTSNKKKAHELLSRLACDLAYFNLANLYACGYFDGGIETVNYYLDKIDNTSIFIDEEIDEDNIVCSMDDRIEITRNNALQNLNNRKLYLFFDTETCGLPKKYDAPSSDLANWPRLVQLSWIICDEKGNRITSKDFIIKPKDFVIPSESSKIHGITTEIAQRRGTDLCLVLDEFMKDVASTELFIGHNIDFDKKVIGAELLRMKKQDIVSSHKSFCTMKSTIDFCKIRNFFGYKYPSLQNLYSKLFGEKFEDAHNSAADIEATYKCYWELKKRNLIQ